jgi:hypothetical protein
MKRRKIWFWLILLLPLLLLVGFSIWAYTPLGPMPEAIAALQSNSSLQVTNDGWLIFQPTDNVLNTGLIIYPGGRVDPRSYAPLAKQISSEGYLVVIVPMPFNLAVFGTNRAMNVINSYPAIDAWVIVGHSLGGSMAARFVDQNQDSVQALVLWASYPASSNDLSNTTLPIMSIYGTEDGLTSTQDINNSHQFLPENTIWIPVEGGNHAQFGWYGDQPGDNPAFISREQQQIIILEAMKDLLLDISS